MRRTGALPRDLMMAVAGFAAMAFAGGAQAAGGGGGHGDKAAWSDAPPDMVALEAVRPDGLCGRADWRFSVREAPAAAIAAGQVRQGGDGALRGGPWRVTYYMRSNVPAYFKTNPDKFDDYLRFDGFGRECR